MRVRRHLGRLRERGLVEIAGTSHNRRPLYFELTEIGTALVQELGI